MVENIVTALIISFTIQIIFFAFAASFKTDKVTDLSYGLTFIIITLFFYILSPQQWVQTVVTFQILVWGLRLSSYLFIRILKTGRDERFDKIRADFLKFAQFWFFQAAAVFIIILPAVVVLTSQKTSITFLTILGFLIWLSGFLIEGIADQQKFEFKNDSKNSNKWVENGLWKYSRHPNYFGEMLCWWGIFIMSIPFLEGWGWLVIANPLFITFILLFVSGISPLEKLADKKFGKEPGYQEYKKRTSVLVPLPPRD